MLTLTALLAACGAGATQAAPVAAGALAETRPTESTVPATTATAAPPSTATAASVPPPAVTTPPSPAFKLDLPALYQMIPRVKIGHPSAADPLRLWFSNNERQQLVGLDSLHVGMASEGKRLGWLGTLDIGSDLGRNEVDVHLDLFADANGAAEYARFEAPFWPGESSQPTASTEPEVPGAVVYSMEFRGKSLYQLNVAEGSVYIKVAARGMAKSTEPTEQERRQAIAVTNEIRAQIKAACANGCTSQAGDLPSAPATFAPDGACFDHPSPATSPTLESSPIRMVSCDGPHRFESMGDMVQLDMLPATLEARSAQIDEAIAACRAAFSKSNRDSSALLRDDLTLRVKLPTVTEWDQGHHAIRCSVTTGDQAFFMRRFLAPSPAAA